MPIFKCKMCGGDLEIAEGAGIAECPYCGTRQTVPRMDSERKANLYDRANHFRRSNEFDKAEGIYEQVLNEDPTDAEAYWSLVLCRYGIEYVEDPATHKRVPTVNRAQYTSVLADENYKKAAEYADTLQRELYEEEAKAINEIQRGILEISEKEDPFDIFICYKETDAQGRRTPDSVLAYDLYTALEKEGYRVFFSRVTLEDKLGTEYEPYIFAALNSAKAMIVLGTKPEFFNAAWVKNEWSRYLALIRGGERKTLIPAYRDMDPYDLPEEFSHLQAQDMSKLGAIQDIIRGLKKLTNKDEQRTAPARIYGNTTGLERLLLNAETFMKLKETEKADKCYSDAVRDYPEDYRGWWGKITCSALHIPECSGNQDKLDARMKQIGQWFEHVRQLCSKEECPILEMKYVEYLRQAAVLDAGIWREKTEQIKMEQLNAINASRNRIQNLKETIADKKQSFKSEGSSDQQRFRDFDKRMIDAENERIRKERDNSINKVLGVIASIIWLFFVVGFFAEPPKGAFWRIVCIIILLLSLGIPVDLLSRNPRKAMESKIKDIQLERESFKKEIEAKPALEKKEIQRLEASITSEENYIVRINKATEQLERYMAEHREEHIRYFHALRCKEIGVDIPAPDSIEIPTELRVGS